ncbi:hypothetical protein [Streptomyces litmocidini]|uniref:hypothetical protein n=1 Tax=Streptomyces litmocidini TaxID=67318 RepID=UPI0036F69DAC
MDSDRIRTPRTAPRTALRTGRIATLAAAALLATVVPSAQAVAEAAPRVDLTVLVVDDGGSAVGAITAELRGSGVPYRRIDLNDPNRPVLDAAFLSDPSDSATGRPRAKYQGVVLPHESAFGPDSAEQTALHAYERTFGIPQVDASTWSHPGVGLDYTDQGGWSGVLDGTTAGVTAAGQAGPFRYLAGALAFEDNDPTVSESYGYAGRPRAGYTSYLDVPVDSAAGGRASLVGEYAADGRRELVVTFAYNQYQRQFRALARGIVDWLTQGVHLGQSRNYLSVHVDDVFAPDARWDPALNCTPGDFDCTGDDGEGANPIRMTAADAQYAAAWQKSSGFTLDMVYNGGQGEQWKTEHGGTDPLTDRLVADRAQYRWINHTYTHPFLGCVQDNTVVPWRCATDAAGNTLWVSRSELSGQIRNNHNWAVGKGIPVDRSELVTGEHSGLRTLPQQPVDNPNLAGALADNGVKWTASDDSREPAQRAVGTGAAKTVPRHPMNVYYNVGTAAEMTDEYNWIYTSRADGGSGVCESDPASTCLPAPLPTATGYADRIVPQEARTALSHVLGNDPRPHYVHQSNLAEERLLYPVLDRVLADYRALFAANTPLVNPAQKDVGTELDRRAAWDQAVAAGRVTAYRVGTTVTVKAPSGVTVPLTAPEGTRKRLLLGTTAFGTPYAGTRSAWTTPELLQTTVTLTLPTA